MISTLNENVLPSDSTILSGDRTQVLDQLEQRLRSLIQLLVPHGIISRVSRQDAIFKTAELYRLASLVSSIELPGGDSKAVLKLEH